MSQRYRADIPTDIRHHLSPKNPLWLACSGGRDSMALLQLCHQLHLPIHVIHINHKLQSPSDDWQRLVADFCQNLHMPFATVNLDFPDPQNVNEQTARTARYQAIIAIIQNFYQGSIAVKPVVALAHHANDQAETVLMNLCQGTGIAGLAGMASWVQQAEFGTPIWLWRPLLSVTREQISEYVTAQNIPFVDDPTNVAGDNQRAFFRKNILPTLAARFGNVVQNISRTSQNMAEIGQIVQGQMHKDLAVCQVFTTPTKQPYAWQADHRFQQCLSIIAFHQLPSARRLQLLHFWLKGEQKFAPNRQFVLAVNDLLNLENPDQQTLLQWQGVQIRRYHDVLYRLTTPYQTLLKMTPMGEVQANFTDFLTFSQIATPIPPLKLAFAQDNKAHFLLNEMTSLPNLTVRMVKLGEKFARLLTHSQPIFHESYKKICQRYQIPSWERGLGMVLLYESYAIALILPNQALWLAGVQTIIEQNPDSPFSKWALQARAFDNPCPFYLRCNEDFFENA